MVITSEVNCKLFELIKFIVIRLLFIFFFKKLKKILYIPTHTLWFIP